MENLSSDNIDFYESLIHQISTRNNHGYFDNIVGILAWLQKISVDLNVILHIIDPSKEIISNTAFENFDKACQHLNYVRKQKNQNTLEDLETQKKDLETQKENLVGKQKSQIC